MVLIRTTTFASFGWFGAQALSGWIIATQGFGAFGLLTAVVGLTGAALALSMARTVPDVLERRSSLRISLRKTVTTVITVTTGSFPLRKAKCAVTVLVTVFQVVTVWTVTVTIQQERPSHAKPA